MKTRAQIIAFAAMCVLAPISAITYGSARPDRQVTARAQPAASPNRTLLNRYCVGCHSERAKMGGLALDTLDVENVAASIEVWEKAVHRKNFNNPELRINNVDFGRITGAGGSRSFQFSGRLTF